MECIAAKDLACGPVLQAPCMHGCTVFLHMILQAIVSGPFSGPRCLMMSTASAAPAFPQSQSQSPACAGWRAALQALAVAAGDAAIPVMDAALDALQPVVEALWRGSGAGHDHFSDTIGAIAAAVRNPASPPMSISAIHILQSAARRLAETPSSVRLLCPAGHGPHQVRCRPPGVHPLTLLRVCLVGLRARAAPNMGTRNAGQARPSEVVGSKLFAGRWDSISITARVFGHPSL